MREVRFRYIVPVERDVAEIHPSDRVSARIVLHDTLKTRFFLFRRNFVDESAEKLIVFLYRERGVLENVLKSLTELERLGQSFNFLPRFFKKEPVLGQCAVYRLVAQEVESFLRHSPRFFLHCHSFSPYFLFVSKPISRSKSWSASRLSFVGVGISLTG